MPISKTRRFEVFKRDGFTCQYCGARPSDPGVVLEVDHIEARANGGTDDDLNLITSCGDCNRGKSDKRLGDIHPRPDADLAYLALEQEAAEVRRYLAAKEQRDQIQDVLMEAFDQLWASQVGTFKLPPDYVYRQWLAKYSPEDIDRAIRIVGPKYKAGRIQQGVWGCTSYVWGILKNFAGEGDG